MPQAFDEDPIEAFKRNIYVSPFHEDDLGAPDRRHRRPTTCCSAPTTPTPRAWPSRARYVDHLPEGLPEEDVAKIMGGNLARIMRVEAPVTV